MAPGRNGMAAAGCAVCDADALHELAGFAALTRVTSDSRTLPPGGRLAVCMRCGAIQKIPDARWRAEIDAIYADFSLDRQSDGEEQLIFDANGIGLPRSQRIVDFLAAPDRLATPRKMLDFGCGRGATLKVISGRWTDCALYGTELGTATEAELIRIPGFRKLYTGGPEAIDQRFDLVTLVHSLAHVTGPVDVLRKLHGCMEDEAALFIQTPDATKNLFYILVADALTHFTGDTLLQATARAGFHPMISTDAIAANELTYLGRRADRPVMAPAGTDPERVLRDVAANIHWLQQLVAKARGLAAAGRSFGIFGSSLAASWLAAEIGERFDFFVDEDRRRSGKVHMGRPIIDPETIPAGAAIFVPLAPNVAARVAARLQARGVAATPPDALP
ncbi:MAG TPA: class I SAM-dependent methyltransferase [Dongiaceae bacterium]|nr:class I SAM-dependent methyltransferase [Dongiaceae bacterium]